MAKDSVKEFVGLRDRLLKERAEIETRLLEINRALGGQDNPAAAPKRGNPVFRHKNALSLREAVLKVLGKSAMTKQEILEAVQGTGYKFGGKSPLNSLNVLLYGKKPKFKNVEGKFSVA